MTIFQKYIIFVFLILLPFISYATESSVLHIALGVGNGSTSKNGFEDSSLTSITVGYPVLEYGIVLEVGYQEFENFNVKSFANSRIEIEAFTVAFSKQFTLSPSFSFATNIGLMRYETQSFLFGSHAGNDSDVSGFLGLTGTYHYKKWQFSLNNEWINDIGGTDISAVQLLVGYTFNL